jgi:uncharacterized Zn-binding protein involved in type VI secretion
MGAPAAVAGDRITGICAGHQIPSPAGAPVPAPPMPFSAPLTTGLATQVLIGGKPAAVVGSGGLCVPPHVGLHASDPFMAPPMQRGTIVQGATMVLIEGKPAASAQSQATMCLAPATTIIATAMTVLIG